MSNMKNKELKNSGFQAVIAANDKTSRFVSKSMSIGDEIIEALDKKKMTRKDLADKLGCSETLISRWLGGLQNFTLRTITSIEEVLEVDLILTTKKAAERYKKPANFVVTQVVVHSAGRDLPYQRSLEPMKASTHHTILPNSTSIGAWKNECFA